MRLFRSFLSGAGYLVLAALVPGLSSEAFAQERAAEADFLNGIDPDMRLDPMALAHAFLDNGRPDLACSLLSSVFGADTENVQALGLLSDCTNALGDRRGAIAYAERGFALAPSSLEMRARLGGLYLADGRTELSRRVFAGSMKAHEGSEAAAFLAEMARRLPSADPALAAPEGPKRWSAEIFSGLVYDSNVNGGPDSATVAGVVGGVPLTFLLSDDSQPKDGWGNITTVNGSYLHPLAPRWALLFQGSLGATTYFSEDRFSTDSGAASAALLYRAPSFSFSLQPNARFVRQDHHLDEALYGVTGRGTYYAGENWRVTASLGYALRNVSGDDGRDADFWYSSAGASYVFGDGTQLGGEYLLQQNDAREDVNTYWRQGPLVYATRRFMPGLTGTASYRYSFSRYDERMALFPETREDKQHVLGLGLDWDVSRWTAEELSVRAQYSYIDTRSTVELYEHDRHIVNTGLAFRF